MHFGRHQDDSIEYGHYADLPRIDEAIFILIVDAMDTRLQRETLFPHLVELLLYSEYGCTNLSEGLLRMCTAVNFGRPKELTLHEVSLSSHTFVRMSENALLQHLHYRVTDYDIKMPPAQSLQFHNLQFLRLFLHFHHLIGFLESLGPLNLWELTIQGLECGPSVEEFSNLLAHIRTTCNHDTLTVLEISTDMDWDTDLTEWVEYEMEEIAMVDLEPLACFSYLEIIRISEATEVQVDQVTSVARFLAKTFPHLKELGTRSLRRAANYTPKPENADWDGVRSHMESITGRTICTRLLHY